MKIDAVFSGGGVKAYAYIGVLKSIEENKLILERVAGTSAGAIVASLVAANYTLEELTTTISELDLKQFIDPPKFTKYLPMSKWLLLYFQLGINKGDRLENWLYDLLAEKGLYTFNDIKNGYLKVVVSDLSLGKLIVIPDDLNRVYGINPNHFPISKAVRMSAGFPYFFMPKKLPGKTNKKSIIIDGGLLSNFPLWIFENGDGQINRPVLGVKFTSKLEKLNQPAEINNAYDMFHALFTTMKQAHDARYISKSQLNNILFIPVDDVGAVNFHISQDTKEKLYQSGKINADNFLKHWPN
ncbi:patatin-like phospholipase family protein [Oceanobacillus chungangensis]|uniref:PNPLA domain-containing protein n=1 Tax=Oceanobacillus chungangensis TaxID=1229152 RepID=A0A3D8Q2Y2_9BACI|nr:patatin-like phospholipase family protein [Oceanobacillus chungangensis]RDW21949.1 hypothetical protein CWR45_00215 [Oceanobacillus chungangensis]